MEFADFARIAFGLIAVIGMIGLAALAARKAGLASASGGFVRKRRLGVVETLALDGRRRIAIIKCDGKEHLIMLGATNELVVDKDLAPPPVEEASEEEADGPPAFVTMSDFMKKLQKNNKEETRDAA